jgi:DNA-binding CsgD family transcriptional regulator
MEQLLERESELARIAELVAVARAGAGAYGVLEGPAGIGKSALVDAAGALAREEGFHVLSARGGELESDFPYGVVRQLFEPALARATARERRSFFSGAAAVARPLLEPDTRQPEATFEQGGRLFATLHALYWLTVNLAASAPVLITVDDGHWADAPSLRFLHYLRHRLEDVPLVLITALRTGEQVAESHLVTQLAPSDADERIRPTPLTEAVIADMMGEAVGVGPDRRLAAACHAATGGNPFLLRELAGALAAEGVASAEAAVDRVAGLGPGAVARSVLLRIARLPPGAGELAQAVVVLGAEAELRHAATLVELDQLAAAEGVDALVRAEILRPGVPLTFVHPIVRAAVYSDLAPGARMRLHERAAQLLAREGAAADVVAVHLLETEPAARPDTVAHLKTAAAHATASGAPEIAVNHLRRALAEPPAEDERNELLRELGRAELAAGDPEAGAGHLSDALEQSTDAEARVTIGLLLRTCLAITGRMEAAVAVVDQIVTELNPDERRWEPVLEAGAVSAAFLDLSLASRLTGRVESLRQRAAHPDFAEPLSLAVAACATTYANESPKVATELALRALDRLDEVHAGARFSAEAFVTFSLMVAERFDLASRWADVFVESSRRQGLIFELGVLTAFRSMIAYRCGRLVDAEKDARDALEAVGLYGQEAYAPQSVAALIAPLVERGALDDADALLDRNSLSSGHEDSSYFSLLLHARGRLRLAQGRLSDALEDLLRFRRLESDVIYSPSYWSWRSDAALTLLGLGEAARAQQLAEEELALAREFGAPRTLGVALRVAGLATGGKAGLDLLEEAVAVLEASPATLEYARALTDLGAALRRANRRAAAREPLRRGLDLATRCDADVLARRAWEELAATGARPRKAELTGLEALTASERRIADMAASGMSNPEIAQALFLTRRTVETHLTHVYQKLDIGSRELLPAALEAEPTTPA